MYFRHFFYRIQARIYQRRQELHQQPPKVDLELPHGRNRPGQRDLSSRRISGRDGFGRSQGSGGERRRPVQHQGESQLSGSFERRSNGTLLFLLRRMAAIGYQVEWKSHNVTTLGQTETDNNN